MVLSIALKDVVVHRCQVELLDVDVKAGLKLSPTVREVTVIDQPVDGIRFVQYRAKISGTVHCLGICWGFSIFSDLLSTPYQGR